MMAEEHDRGAPSRVDVAIVGGGTAGCSAALHLRRRGASVALLEQRLCGSQASGVNYGGVRQHGRHLAELPLAARSRRIWARLPELVGHDGEFRATGHLKIARDEPGMAELEHWARDARAYGLDVQLFGGNAIRARHPWLGEQVVGASWLAEDGQANPRLVAPLFAKAARAASAEIHEQARVVAIERAGPGFHLATETGIEVRAGVLINVAGAWGADIAALFGETVPEHVEAPNMCVSEPLPYFIDVNIGAVGAGVYIRQDPRGNVIFGGGYGIADKALIRAWPQPESTRQAVRGAIEVVPALRSAHVIRNWTGIEGFMPDGIPVIGPSATTPGLIHAFGFSGHGFQLGPGMGAILAELALDGQSPTPLAPFAISRFTTRLSNQ
jgi:sarcosine oxidase subunit beta